MIAGKSGGGGGSWLSFDKKWFSCAKKHKLKKLSLTTTPSKCHNSLFMTLTLGRCSIVPSLMFVYKVVLEELKHTDRMNCFLEYR